ncbi:hypothetical protein NCG97_19040 [Streptomyces lydicamycinicus]|nr:hypothetical protein NCG97_19040 [Streptomyces lydicamycinicus]
MDEDFVKPRRRGRWLKRSLFIALALAVVGGGCYAGYNWTQTQYFVGAKDDHIALYRGISQDLAWIRLNDVDEEHPEIELKYLPPYQRNQVKETIAVDNRTQASEKVTELSKQANACRSKEQREAAERDAARHPGHGQTGTPSKPGSPSQPASPSAKPGSTGKSGGTGTAGALAATTSPSPTATPSQAPSQEQQKLEKNCSTQQ